MNTQVEPASNIQGDQNDLFPFYFPKVAERDVPMVIAQKWAQSSHYFFFYNGLTSKDSIQRFLRSQSLKTLENIAAAFDLEVIDLVSEKRKTEGVIVTVDDKETIVEAILSSVTC